MYFFTLFGITECCLLAAMAYDRYVAICNPLRYNIVMNKGVCTWLAAASWMVGVLVGLGQTNYVFSLTYCGPNRINHFFCDIPPLLKLACGDTFMNVIAVYMVALLFITAPFMLILVSYIYIITSILRMPSPEGRRKAFSTCSSHLIVVSLFYGSGIFTYLKPKSSYSTETDKFLALFYTVVTSMLNPIIYSLRNKEGECKVAWLNISSAFGFMFHCHIFNTLQELGMLDRAIDLIQELCSSYTTTI
ncbi:olfactory receptor 10C1-like [Alligator mississippiensis]|uniref:Olfactory receptor n=1 Tax=Alligator mississippiensis TaxID=8496 RepID=A0A151NH59_ALLMI|nr:olfactory receptor 10C1-like [Alligator mississippiensis]